MKIYENKDRKREIQCNYCFHDGHNKRNCPTMRAHWEGNSQVHETYDHLSLKGVDVTMFPSHYSRFWGDEDAKRQFRSHWVYMKKRFATNVETKTKKRRKPKCGFCGSTAHNRRNCNKLKNFVHVLKETNKGYRAAFYDKFVEGMGLGAGALVSTHGYNGEGVALITSFPSDKVMFTNLLRQWSDYHSRLPISLNEGGEKYIVNLGHDSFRADIYAEGFFDEVGIWKNMYSTWGRINHVVSPAPNRPTKEWFMGQSPCFEWVVKKKNQLELMSQFSHLIKEFYPHNNLRTKLGAKVYDQYYTR